MLKNGSDSFAPGRECRTSHVVNSNCNPLSGKRYVISLKYDAISFFTSTSIFLTLKIK
jgi:hypothetical protein